MSQTVDQRVVEMRFDNKQFESAIADTQKSVKNFNKDLDKEFGESSKSLNKLEGAADKVRIQFNLWDMFKFEALHRVLDGLISKAESLTRAFTIDQVSAGWQKYADKTEAVQMIMNALDDSSDEVRQKLEKAGGKMEYVEQQLDKLNWFADETSYSFIDMTSNVGKFTAAGVELETAVTAMQGISTWAALSGANTEQASRAMYNLSQAMGMGSVRTQDWMSIENANMATKEFKEMAIQAALVKKTLAVDNDGIVYAPNTKAGVDVTAENFRSTLSEGWFTSEVLLEVLEQYGKATDVLAEMQSLSGIDTTSELLNFIEAYNDAASAAEKEDIFNKFIKEQDIEDDAVAVAKLREQFELLATSEYTLALKAFRAAQEAKTFKEAIDATKDAVSTKWMNVFQDIFGSYETAKKLWTDVSNILWDIFAGPIDNLHEATKQWSENGGLEDVHAIITGILQAISDVWQAIRDTINLIRYGTTDAEEVAEKKAERFKAVSGAIRAVVEGIQEFVTSEPFQNALLAVGEVIASLVNVFRAAWNVIKVVVNAIMSAFSTFISSLRIRRKEEVKQSTFIVVLDWIRDKLDKFAEWLNSSGVLKFIADTVGAFVTFLLKIPGKINKAFKALTGVTIGEAFKKLFEKIKQGFQWLIDNKVFQSIWNGIKSFFSMIGNGLKRLAGVETYGELFEKIRKQVVKAFTAMINFFKSVGGRIKKLTKVNTFGELLVKIKDNFIGFLVAIKNFFSKKKTNGKDSLISTAETTSTAVKGSDKAVGFFKSLGAGLGKFFEGLGAFVKESGIRGVILSLGELIKGTFRAIIDFVKAIDWKDLLGVAVTITTFSKAISRIKIAQGIKNIGDGIQKIGTAAKWMSDAAIQWAKAQKRYARASQFRAIAMMLLGLAVAVGIIAFAIYKLGQLDPEVLNRGASIVIGIFLAIGTLILGILLVLTSMSKSSFDERTVKASSKSATKIIVSMSVMLLVLSVFVGRIVSAIVKLAKVKDPDRLEAAGDIVIRILLVTFALIILLLAVVSNRAISGGNAGKVTMYGDKAYKMIKAVSGIFLALAIVTFVLAFAITKLAKIEDPNKLRNAAIAVGAILVALVLSVILIVAVLRTMSKTSGDSVLTKGSSAGTILSVAVLLLGLAIAVKIMVGALTQMVNLLNKVGGTKVLQALGLLGLILLALGVVFAILAAITKGSGAGAGVAFLGMAVAIVAMAIALNLLIPVITFLAQFKFATLAKVAGGIALILIAFGVGGLILKQGMAGLLAFAAFVGILAVSLLLVSIAVTGLSVSLVAFGAALVTFCATITASASIIKAGFKVMAEAFVVMITTFISGLLDALGDIAVSAGEFFSKILNTLCDIIVETAPHLFKAIEVLLLGALQLLIDVWPKVIEALTVIVNGVFQFIIDITPKLVEMLLNLITKLLAALAENAYAIGESLMKLLIGVIQAVADNIKPLVKAMADLLVNIFDSLSGELPRIMESLGGLLFSIVDNTIGALVKAVFSSFGSALSAFAEASSLFWETMKSVDPNAIHAISMLGEMMLALSAGAFLDALGNFLSFGLDMPPLVSLGLQLVAFAPCLKAFAEQTQGINAEHVEHVAHACQMLGELASSLPKYGGLFQVFTGKTMDMKTFGAQLQSFGEAFVMFYNAIKPVIPIDEESVTTVKNVAESFAELYDKLPKQGGWIQKIFGENMSLKDFGEQLRDFGLAFVQFYKAIEPVIPVDSDSVESVKNVAESFAGLYNILPREGGWTQKIFGEAMSLGKFGTQLAEFGLAFVMFYNAIKVAMPVDKEIVETVSKVAETFAGLYSKLPREGGWIDNLLGKPMHLSSFGTDLENFAWSFVKFYNIIKRAMPVDTGLVDTVSNVAETFAGLYEKLPREDGWIDNLFGKPMNLKGFGADLVDFATGFNMFYAEISKNEIDKDIVGAVSAAAETMAGLYTKINAVGESGWLESIFGKKTINLSQFGKQLEDFGKGFNQFYTEISKNEINKDIVGTVTSAAETMAGLYDIINGKGRQSGWLESIFGSKTIDLSQFGNQLSAFGTGFSQFYTSIEGLTVDENKVKTVKNAGAIVAELYDSLEGEKGGILGAMASAWKGDAYTNKKNALNHAIELMGIMAEGVSKHTTNFASQSESMRAFTNTMLNFIQAVGVIANEKDLLKELKDNGTALNTFISTMASSISTASGTAFTATGNKFVAEIVTAMTNRFQPENLRRTQEYDAFEKSVATFASFFSELLRLEIKKDAEDVALNVIEGLIIGLAKGAGQTEQAAASLAQNIIRPLKNTLQTHSPSKVTEQLGKYVSEGLAIGIRSQSALVDNASSDLAFGAIDMMSEAIRASRDIVDNALDDGSMVLTPVLDLSQIQNGALAISQMMDSTSGYSIGGTFDYANKAEASRRSADISESAVISMDKLSGAIEDLIRNPQGAVSNNFTINSTADPQEIALEVSKIIQLQVERRQAIWGR